MKRNPLASAIRDSVLQSVRKSPPISFSEEARIAKESIETAMHSASGVRFPPRTDRIDTTIKLLRASCDHGRALVTLLEVNHKDFGGSAIALHRMQIEQFLRGTFFSRPASDEDVSYFLREDEMPKRQRGTEGQRTLSLNELAAIAADYLELEPRDKLVNMVRNARSPLNGMVHGGRTVLLTYQDGDEQIGFNADIRTLRQITDNATVIANFCLAVSVAISANTPEERSDLLRPTSERIQSYQAHIASRTS